METTIKSIKSATDEIFNLTRNSEYNGTLSKIGLAYGLSSCLSNFIPSVLVRYSLLLREGSKRHPEYKWRKEMCGSNMTLAERIHADYVKRNKESNYKRQETKTCSKCKTEKPLSEFGKSNKEKSGKRCQCKECDRTETRNRRQQNKTDTLTLEQHFDFLESLPDKTLVEELRSRGYEVVAQKLIQL